MSLPSVLTIATRESALAMWQAGYVRDRLAALYPGIEIRVLGMTTEGDRRLGVSLAQIGGKGLFVKELENAMAAGEADVAVHSMKDVPMHLPPGFRLAAILEREDPRDAFVSSAYRHIAQLPRGGRVGTSSLRRESQLRARHPHLDVQPLRGNVNTRLRKLDEGRYEAIILAAAGLKRLGLGARITATLEAEESIPAVGQGALGIECRDDRPEIARMLQCLDHPVTAWCVRAERAVSRALAGSCTVPLGAYAAFSGDEARMRAFVASPDGSRMANAEAAGARLADDPERFGQALAGKLEQAGAREILAALPQ